MHKKLLVLPVSIFGLLLLKAVADGTITEVRPQRDELRLNVRTFAGEHYQLQYSTNLVSGIWENLREPFLAEGGSTNLLVSTGADCCWFRVVENSSEPRIPTGPPGPPPPPPLADG